MIHSNTGPKRADAKGIFEGRVNRGRFEQGNASLDALNQNTQVIDEGADHLYVFNVRPGFEGLERQFDPSAPWLHRTEVILSE